MWGPSFKQNWILFTQRFFVSSLVEISPLVWSKKKFKFPQCIFPFLLSSSLGKRWGPSFEQTWILFTLECLMPSLVEISPMILEKIFKVSLIYFRYVLLSPLGKGWGPSFEQTWIYFTKECSVLSLAKIGPVALEEKKKIWKVYKDDDNNDGQPTNCDQNLLLRWAKKHMNTKRYMSIIKTMHFYCILGFIVLLKLSFPSI